MRRRDRNAAQRLRLAVEALPGHTKDAMLRGIDANQIIVGAYVDPGSGGICPMLAAHRNGGRTSLASFARAWDRYTDARQPRLATRREVRTLRSLLQGSLAVEATPGGDSIAALAAQIRAEREAFATGCTPAAAEAIAPEGLERRAPAARLRPATGERHRGRELRARPRWSWLRPTRRYDEFRDLLAAAGEQLAEQRLATDAQSRDAERLPA